MARECSAPQCNLPIPHDQLMCERHWARVPYGLQVNLWDEMDNRGTTNRFMRLADKASAIVGAREGVMQGHATFSDDMVYRYLLSRRWHKGPTLRWILCNPSVADAQRDTPTMKKIAWYTSEYQYSGFIVANLFAFRSPNPNRLRKADDPVGPKNNSILKLMSHIARTENYPIVVGWGGQVPIRPVHRVYEVMQMLKGVELWCLGSTSNGNPIHPRSAPGGARFKRWPLQ